MTAFPSAPSHVDPGLSQWWSGRPVWFNELLVSDSMTEAGRVNAAGISISADALSALPKVGERVPEQVHSHAWLADLSVEPIPRTHVRATLLTEDGRMVEHQMSTAADFVAMQVHPDGTEPETTPALAGAVALYRRQAEGWKDTAQARLHEYAETHALGADFDQALLDAGLAPRGSGTPVRLSVTGRAVTADIDGCQDVGEWALCHDDRDGWDLLLTAIGIDPKDPTAERIYGELIAAVEILGGE